MVKQPPFHQKIKRNTKIPYKGAAHTPASPKGMGDYYGTAFPAKIAKMKSGVGFEVLSPKKLAEPPRTLT